MKRLAVVWVRGTIGTDKRIKDILALLGLYRKNSCAIIADKPNNISMLNIVKDYVTWGEADKETLKLLLEKRGKIYGNKPLTLSYLKEKTNLELNSFVDEFVNFKKELQDIPGLKRFFRLKPPVKGFERGGIKRPYSMGGVLGYRKEAINELIKRMI